MRIFWHQRDPRLVDNRGLTAAAGDDTVLPVYVYDPDVLKFVGDRQRAFRFQAYRRLQREYRERDSDLVVRKGATADVLADLAAEYDAAAVYHNRCYHPARRNRARAVADRLPTEVFTDHVLVSPERLAGRYPNHSQFYNDWQEEHKLPPASTPDADALADVTDTTTVPTPDTDIDLPGANHEAARERLDGFLRNGIGSYDDDRDRLEKAATSRLSVYLNNGLIGIREVWRAVGDRLEAATGGEHRNIEKYRYELSWREQMVHLLYHNPRLLSENYKRFERPIGWRDGEAAERDLAAWKAGETGYPLVDAGMRQLDREGYMHNRTRQNVASFLTKHLLIDWREGARHFTRQLLDHDPGVNYGSWQWTASTGTDSVDVRIFDPVSQLSKYDEGAAYVREYVPELADVPTGKIVDWPTLSAAEREDLAPDYQHPIVDRNEGYERAQREFEAALGKR